MTDTAHESLTSPSTFACPVEPERDIERAFSVSMVVSGVRCTLTYLVLPFMIPFLGLAPGVGPTLGLAIGVVAIAANVLSYRRFRRSSHRWRVPAMVVHVSVIALLVVLMGLDALALIG